QDALVISRQSETPPFSQCEFRLLFRSSSAVAVATSFTILGGVSVLAFRSIRDIWLTASPCNKRTGFRRSVPPVPREGTCFVTSEQQLCASDQLPNARCLSSEPPIAPQLVLLCDRCNASQACLKVNFHSHLADARVAG